MLGTHSHAGVCGGGGRMLNRCSHQLHPKRHLLSWTESKKLGKSWDLMLGMCKILPGRQGITAIWGGGPAINQTVGRE